jgi:hypothetical protein
VGRIKGRLRRLEERSRTSPSEQRDDPVGREVLRWLTTEELDAYEAALIRHEAGEAPTDADRVIADRVQALYEEVRDEVNA